MRWLLCRVLLLVLLPGLLLGHGTLAQGLDQNRVDSSTGLKIAPGWELVKANCTFCHSASFITTQRGDRDTWLAMIRWMQNTQGLWPFDPATEKNLLDYLAGQYPPAAGRRNNLPPALLP